MDALPAETRPIVERLLKYPLLTPQVLAAQVARHLEEFEAECALRGNVEIARRLSGWSHRLLSLWGREEHRPLIQAAILYFVMEGDASDDTLPGGLDDDEAVMRAVLVHLGLEP